MIIRLKINKKNLYIRINQLFFVQSIYCVFKILKDLVLKQVSNIIKVSFFAMLPTWDIMDYNLYDTIQRYNYRTTQLVFLNISTVNLYPHLIVPF